MLKIFGIILAVILLLLVLWAIGGYLFLKLHPVFGAAGSKVVSEKTLSSPYYSQQGFKNLQPVQLREPGEDNSSAEDGFFVTLYKFLFDTSGRRVPDKQLPSIKFDKDSLVSWTYSWLGHSTMIMNIDDDIVVTDPVFYRASPIFLWGSPFDFKYPPKISDLPDIGVVVISHDHYDHLDYKAIVEIESKVAKFLVPLWIKAHLLEWWIESSRVEELDWYESYKIGNVVYTFTPAQHFSWRGLDRKPTTLWWGWAMKWLSQNIYFSGDSGYFDGFKTIGEKYGPFDLAFMENWAYDKSWMDVHMTPEQSVQASIDVKATHVMPIHWWKFNLAFHSWDEPIERYLKAAKLHDFTVLHPVVWEIVNLDTFESQVWWK